jgi:hypothetical protein
MCTRLATPEQGYPGIGGGTVGSTGNAAGPAYYGANLPRSRSALSPGYGSSTPQGSGARAGAAPLPPGSGSSQQYRVRSAGGPMDRPPLSPMATRQTPSQLPSTAVMMDSLDAELRRLQPHLPPSSPAGHGRHSINNSHLSSHTDVLVVDPAQDAQPRPSDGWGNGAPPLYGRRASGNGSRPGSGQTPLLAAYS